MIARKNQKLCDKLRTNLNNKAQRLAGSIVYNVCNQIVRIKNKGVRQSKIYFYYLFHCSRSVPGPIVSILPEKEEYSQVQTTSSSQYQYSICQYVYYRQVPWTYFTQEKPKRNPRETQDLTYIYIQELSECDCIFRYSCGILVIFPSSYYKQEL